MSLAHLVVFPLFAIAPDKSCACGNPACARVGKHPTVAWGEISLGDAVPRAEPGAGVGIKTGAAPLGSGYIVVDVDTPEANAWVAEQDSGPTYTVRTGRGWQYYFVHPGFPVKNSASALHEGVDIRGDGGFVVAAGSPHKSGNAYVVAVDVDPVACPLWLLSWLQTHARAAEIRSYPGDVTDPTELCYRKETYARYLATEATPRGPANRGRGDELLFRAVQRGAYDLTLPAEVVLRLVRAHYDPRCSPMWGDELEERVMHKCHSAKTTSTRARVEPWPQEMAAVLSRTPASVAAAAVRGLGGPKTKAAVGATSDDAPDSVDDPTFGFKIFNDWASTPIPPDFLVTDFLIESMVHMIFAEPGVCKSWVALSLANAVADGTPWLEKKPVKQGRVLYIDYEDGQNTVHGRLTKLQGMQQAREDLHYLWQPGALDGDEAVGIWRRIAKYIKHHDVKLLIIDTLNGAQSGDTDENDVGAATMLKTAGSVANELNVTVLIIHHANKAGDMRGTSAFKSNVDTAFRITGVESSSDGTQKVVVTCTKSGFKKTSPIHLVLTDDGLATYVPEPKAERETGAPPPPRDIQGLITLHLANGPIETAEKIAFAIAVDIKFVRRELKALEVREEIRMVPGVGYVHDTMAGRKARVAAQIESDYTWRSANELAAAAFVTRPFIERMIRDKEMSPKVAGREGPAGYFLRAKI